MLDTHAVARSLTDAELTPAQADAITNAVRLAAEQSDHVTSDQFKSGLAEVCTEIAEVEPRQQPLHATNRRVRRAGLENPVEGALGLAEAVLRNIGAPR